MWRYGVLLFLVLVVAFYYVYVSDPCRNQLTTEFSKSHPSYTILDSSAKEGSRESVRCRISYRKPDSAKIYEEVWLYRDPGTGWQFSRVLEEPKEEQTTDGAPDERLGQ